MINLAGSAFCKVKFIITFVKHFAGISGVSYWREEQPEVLLSVLCIR